MEGKNAKALSEQIKLMFCNHLFWHLNLTLGQVLLVAWPLILRELFEIHSILILLQIPLENGYSQRLADAIQTLICKSRYLPLTVDNLNKLVYVPKKDYESNRLETGLLQLTPHTHLLLDETAMQNGQLDAEGVRNLTALGNLVSTSLNVSPVIDAPEINKLGWVSWQFFSLILYLG